MIISIIAATIIITANVKKVMWNRERRADHQRILMEPIIAVASMIKENSYYQNITFDNN